MFGFGFIIKAGLLEKVFVTPQITMKIVALTKYFPPEIGTASHLFFELCETLVQHGHQVTAITGMPWYNLSEVDPRYRGRLVLKEQLNGIKVIRIAEPPFPSDQRVKLGHVTAPLMFCLAGLLEHAPDVVAVYSPPLMMGLTAQVLSRVWGVPFVFNAQDLYPQCLIDLGQLRNPVLIRLFEEMESYIYRKASFITVHSQGNMNFLVNTKGVSPEKIEVAHNWVDTDLISPGSRNNEFAQQHGLTEKFVVSFAGTMGISQGIASVVEAAAVLQAYPDILFLLVGGGIEKELAERRTQELDVKNIKFLPMQPRETYPQILQASDVCLVTLRKDIKTPVVPSKIMGIMAAGRSVLASIPLHGDAPRLIDEAQSGICVEPENPEALAGAILRLYQEQELRESFGQNGRHYAVTHFSREGGVARYETLFQEAINRHKIRKAITVL